jgi:ABC-2 type transport system ATP-binding protein
MPGEPIIQVEGLTKRFGPVAAVDDLYFEIRSGQIAGLIGPNGAGKTTTIQMLLGLTTPSQGRIRIFGLDFLKHRQEILHKVNFSSTYTALPTNLSVWENLDIFSRLYGLRNTRSKIKGLLELFEIPETFGELTGKLSSGQHTRLNLCKALLNDPEILFLDEPTASLDPDIADKLRELLLRVQQERGLTVIYTSHNMHEVEKICDPVIFLSRGRIVAQGSPREVMAGGAADSLEDFFISLARQGAGGRS